MKRETRAPLPLALLLLAPLSLAGCGDGDDGSGGAPARTAPATAGEQAGATDDEEAEPGGRSRRSRDTGVDNVEVVVTPAEGAAPGATATLSGTVFLDGKAPKRRAIAMDHVPGCKDHGGGLTETVLATEDGRLQNVFVYITRGIDRASVPPPPEEPAVLDQEGCLYKPHALVVRAGQELVIRNLDKTNHNVNARPSHGSNKPFNTMQPPKGQDIVKVFPRAEVAIPFGCDIHPWMKSYVAVVDHDFHAISDEEGNWSIEGLAPGEYLVEAWHEKYKGQKAVVTVGAGDAADVRFRYDARR